jgi:uncharacterized protein (TIGR03118 family)
MRRILAFLAATGLLFVSVASVGAKSPHSAYDVHVLVSDIPGAGDVTDANLVNAWGLARSTTSPWWVADADTEVSTVYNGSGTPFPVASPIVVSVPGGPTGLVADTTPGFMVTGGLVTARANFLFATEGGQILGWSPLVDPATAVLGLDRSGVDANYKGLAIALVGGIPHLYAADFHNGRIDVVTPDATTPTIWAVQDDPGAFQDPGLPAGFAPFGIQNIGEQIFVTYAKQDADAEDELAAPGNGFVDVYDTDGSLLSRFAAHGPLNAPWGVAQAPQGFGRASGALLIGNFGDGRINAYDPASGKFLGALRDEQGGRIAIDGLWALAFGNGVIGTPQTLLFTAGPDEETHGLFGELTPAPRGDDE